MSILLAIVLLGGAAGGVLRAPRVQDPVQTPRTERIELRKDGGPGCGPDQPFHVREIGASDLDRFIGGKQVVMVAPYDLFIVLLIVVLVVVLIIVL